MASSTSTPLVKSMGNSSTPKSGPFKFNMESILAKKNSMTIPGYHFQYETQCRKFKASATINKTFIAASVQGKTGTKILNLKELEKETFF